MDEITHLIVEKLLLTPTEQLKSVTDAETVGAYNEALTRLFGLAEQDPSTRADESARSGQAREPGADESARSQQGAERPARAEGRVEPFTRTRPRTPR